MHICKGIIFLILRSNHKLMMNQMYGFDGEVNANYSVPMAELLTEVYNWFSLAHCYNHKVPVSIFQSCIICIYIYSSRNRKQFVSYSFTTFNSPINYKRINYKISYKLRYME